VKGSDWLGDQDAIEFMCKEAPAAVIELSTMVCRFRAREDGRIYQRPFGGMTTHFGKGSRSAPVLRPIARAMPCCNPVSAIAQAEASFFIEYFALDLIMRMANAAA